MSIVAKTSPYAVEVEADKRYFWCRCGRSANQPFCDGSHKGTEYTPEAYQSEVAKVVYFCGCKQTGNAPLCDGSHKSLTVAEGEEHP